MATAAELLERIAARKKEAEVATLPPLPLSLFLHIYCRCPNQWQAMQSNNFHGLKAMVATFGKPATPTCLAYSKNLPSQFATWEVTKLAEILGIRDWRIIAWSLLEMYGIVNVASQDREGGG